MQNSLPKILSYLLVICIVSCSGRPSAENSETTENQPTIVTGKGLIKIINYVMCGYTASALYCAYGQLNTLTNEFTVAVNPSALDINWPILSESNPAFSDCKRSNVYMSCRVNDEISGLVMFDVSVAEQTLTAEIDFSSGKIFSARELFYNEATKQYFQPVNPEAIEIPANTGSITVATENPVVLDVDHSSTQNGNIIISPVANNLNNNHELPVDTRESFNDSQDRD